MPAFLSPFDAQITQLVVDRLFSAHTSTAHLKALRPRFNYDISMTFPSGIDCGSGAFQ
jgi:hypothetical protein